MPFLRNHLPKTERKKRIREVVRDFEIDVCESVCSVQRIAEVISSEENYHSIPVVNISGKLIGLIPKNFLIVLLENLKFYEYKGFDANKINKTYATAKKRFEV
jgi:CBS-domain-containing membrane protein